MLGQDQRRRRVAAGVAVSSAAAAGVVIYLLARKRGVQQATAPAPRLPAPPAARYVPPMPKQTPTPAVPTLEKLAADAAYAANVPPPIVKGVTTAESNWSNKPTIHSITYGTSCITSKAGAVGLMQVLPATARSVGVTGDLCVPANSFVAGSRYLRKLYQQYGNWRLAALAYNQGPGNVKGYLATNIISSGGNKLPDGRRTVTKKGIAYADKVMAAASRYGLAGTGYFAGGELDEPLLALV